MKLLGNMWLMIILKVPTKQDFTLSPEDIFLEKTHGGLNPPHPAFLGLNDPR